jgi:hypothetical protein
MNRRGLLIVGASTVVIAGLVTAGIAHARSAEDSPPGQARGQFGLTVTHGSGAPITVALACDPVGGNHPHAEEACADLAAVNGHIENIPPKQGAMCPHYVSPVRATATGRWQSTSISYDHTFSNACEMTRATGEVFDF